MGQDLDGEAAVDYFGLSVALSADGSRLAAGARTNDASGTNAGHVRVFDWNAGTGAWVQVGADIDGEAAGDWFGASVSLSADGSRLAAGGYLNDGDGTDVGHVRVFDWSGSAWVQVGADLDGEAAGDEFGQSVSLSADGSRLAAGGTYWGNDGDGTDAGRVRVFKQAGESQSARHTDWDPAQPVRGTKVWVVSHGRVTSCLDPRGGR